MSTLEQTMDEQLPIRKSLLYDIVNKQDLQTTIDDKMARFPWQSYNNGEANGGGMQLSPKETKELFTKLYNDVKIDGRSVSALKTHGVIQTDGRSLSSIEPSSETEGVVLIDDRNRDMKGTQGPPQFLQPKVSSLLANGESSLLAPIASIGESPLGSNSALQMGGTAKIPTRTFQDVEEIIKGDKQGDPVAVPLRPLDRRVANLALLKFLEQENTLRDLSRNSPQPGATPRIMEFQRVLDIDPNILKSGPGNLENIEQGTSLRQRVLHDVKPLQLLESGLRRDPNIADQKSLHTVQELVSTAGGLGNYRQVPVELKASPDSDALAEVARPLGYHENGDAERLTSRGDGPGRVGSFLQDPTANAGGSRTTLQDVFNSLNRIEQFGSFQNRPLAVNPYARGSLLSHDQKHPEGPGKPAQTLGHGARNQKNPKGGGGGGAGRRRRRKRRRRERKRRKRREKEDEKEEEGEEA